jgi:hypothetical protein
LWTEITNANEETKAEYPYGYRLSILATATAAELDDPNVDLTLYMHTDKTTIKNIEGRTTRIYAKVNYGDSPGGDPGSGADKNRLAIQNCPGGFISVAVYATSSLPTNITELGALSFRQEIHLGAGYGTSSPITVQWTRTNYTGTNLILLQSSTSSWMALVYFDANGCGTVDFNTMTDTSTLTY